MLTKAAIARIYCAKTITAAIITFVALNAKITFCKKELPIRRPKISKTIITKLLI